MSEDYIFFKYRKIDKYFLSSLVNSELYFARPDRLNDPFDCKVNILKSLENAVLKSDPPSRTRLEKLRGMHKFYGKLESDLANMGVCSFSLELNNPLMWSHYADSHRGVCLTYSFPPSFFKQTAHDILGVAPVEYDNNPLSDWFIQEAHRIGDFEEFGISLLQKALTVKAKLWEYEKEVRIIRATEGVQALDKHYLKQVCFGLATPDDDIALVKRIIGQVGYSVTICKMQRSPESDFGLEVLEI